MVKKLNFVAIIQARSDSKRLPKKIFYKYKNISYLEILIRRLKQSKKIQKIVLATSKNKEDDQVEILGKKLKINTFRGSEKDVTDRYFKAAKWFKAKNIVRITGDCPLVDSSLVDQLVEVFSNNNYDYVTNTMPPTYPDGFDIEVFNYNSLKKSWIESRKKNHLKEHVTTHIRENNIFKKKNIYYKKNFAFLRLTLDYQEDVVVLNSVLKNFKNIYKFGIDDVIALYKKNNKIFFSNMKIKRNEGLNLSTGQKVWKRAKKIIPGGSMLFSKNPDLFLPNKWPAYFKKSKGCKIWDLDENVYNDLSYMGVGTNILGYSHPKIEKKVIKTIKDGTMTTLNSTEEIQLAEKLIQLHPWSEMVRFTRSGGEANAVAIRIARAASGKENIAFCGYHGWHDWYLSCNISSRNNLSSHLMNDVPIGGVPKSLKNTAFAFEYNNFNQLKKIVDNNQIGVIKMEVKRNEEPKNDFLKKVRKLADQKNIVLIFDECTSGFRQALGGLHKFYKVNPDIAIFGKALGNGYAINAIIGNRSVMEFCNKSFVSSTFWTERIGPTAALETLNIMEKIKSWKIITENGKLIKKNWRNLSNKYKLNLKISGLDAIPNFSFNSQNNLKYKTFITQEMLSKKILASNAIYCTIAHSKKLHDDYFNILDDIFNKISKFESGTKDIKNFLKYPTSISGIRETKINYKA